jgi:hypothetical protein
MARLALGALLVTSSAWAAPLAEPHIGGVVFAGATQGHVAAMAHNPAAASLLRGTHFFVDGQLRLDGYRIQRSRVGSGNGEPSGTGDLTFPEVSDSRRGFGGFAGFSSDFGGNERFTLGLGVTIAASDRPPEGEATAYHADGGTFELPTLTASASIRATSALAFGFSFHVGLPQLDLRFRRDATLADCTAAPCPVESAAGTQTLRFDGAGQIPTGSFTLGALFRSSGWWFGLALTSPPFKFGESDLPFETDVTLEQPGFPTRTGRARVRMSFPVVRVLVPLSEIRAGVRRVLTEDWDLVVDARLTMGNDEHVTIQPIGAALLDAGLPEVLKRWQPRQPALRLSGGLEQNLDPERLWRIGAQLFGETAGVATRNLSAAQIEGPKLGAAAGLELRPTTGFSFGVGYSLAWSLPRDVGESAFSPSAQIDCNASGFDLDVCAPVREGRATASASGEYDRLTHYFHANVSLDFW